MHVRNGAEDIMMIAWLFFARLTEQFLHWGPIMPQTRSDQNTQNHVTRIVNAIKAVSSQPPTQVPIQAPGYQQQNIFLCCLSNRL